MKKSLIALALVSAFAVPAFADEPTPEHTLTGNITLASSYRFRGIDQTFGKPALQGGFDYSHSSGFYVGNWNSNVSSGAGYAEGNLEMDFYGGYKTTVGDFGLDLGVLQYYYPGSAAKPLSASNLKKPTKGVSGTVDNTELYIAGTWQFLTLKYSHAIGNYFDLPASKGTHYLELNANYDLGDGWGVNGHIGHLSASKFKDGTNDGSSTSINYSDWKVGVTKDLSGWVLGLSYVGTNANGSCSNGEFYCFANSLDKNANLGSKDKDAGRGIAVLSVTKTF